MLLSSLIDAGCPPAAVDNALAACDVAIRVSVDEVFRAGIRGALLRIEHTGAVADRTLASCIASVHASGLPDAVARPAAATLEALGSTEARLHGVAASHVHLHELSAVDTMVDVVGTCAALHAMAVDDVRCSPLPAAPGTVDTEHGELPLPAPATLMLLAAARAPLIPGVHGVEQVTPTAAALLATLARFEPSPMRLLHVGHGAGNRDDPRRPNLVRCWIGEPLSTSTATGAAGFDDAAVELRTNLDDCSPALVADLAERCLTAGALDTWVVPATMKKGRPGHVLHVLVPAGAEHAVAGMLLAESPTLGIRRTDAPRMVAERDTVELGTRWGPVRVKRKRLGVRVVDAHPELDDCRRIAGAHQLPLHQVVDELTAAARAAFVDAATSGPRKPAG
jgi:uncharacterized protein (TIGR00299 family) protein